MITALSESDFNKLYSSVYLFIWRIGVDNVVEKIRG